MTLLPLRTLRNHKLWVAASVGLLMYLALAIVSAITESPGVDEGYFANPALNLITKGSMGTTVMESSGTAFPNIHRYTYWIMPLHPLTLAGWYGLFGFSVLSTRSYSIFWGLVALVSWFFIVRALFQDKALALLSVVLISFDYILIVCASTGRMDMMSAALGFAAIATYLTLRLRSFEWAVFLSQSLVVASGLTHPMGILHFFGVAFLIFYFDRKRLTVKVALVAIIPYVIGAGAWGSYILRDSSAFVRQFVANATMGDPNIGGRFAGLSSPLTGLKLEITDRYLATFGWGERSPGHSGPTRLKILILIGYVTGVISTLLIRELRQRPGYRALLLVTGIYFLGLSIIDSQKAYYYLVHITSFYLVMVAGLIQWCWGKSKALSAFAVLALAGLIVLEVAGISYRAKQNNYQSKFTPAIRFLKNNSNEKTSIAASSAVAFGLGFPPNIIHDAQLGYESRRKFDLIVIDPEFQYSIETSKQRAPQLHEYITRLLATEYQQIYQYNSYSIYSLK